MASIKHSTHVYCGNRYQSLLVDFCLTILATRPTIQAKLKAELRQFFPDGSNMNIDYATLEKLKFTTAILRETGRLYPVTGGVVRYLEEFRGVPLPPNAVMFLYFYLMHRCEDYFSNPLTFIPERWLPDSKCGETADAEAYAPFSSGFRSCLGKFLAMQEMKTMLATLLRNHTVEFTSVPDGIGKEDLPPTRFYALLHVPEGYRVKFVQDR